MSTTTSPSSKKAEHLIPLQLPATILGVLAGAYAVSAQPDYAPAIYRPMSGCSHWYTTGFGHKLAVIHDMEGYYLSSISLLNDCSRSVSIHYLVNGHQDASTDSPAGEISQSVREANYAWHATCWNQYSFGTEHEGFASNPAWYTDAMFVASSGLQRHLCDTYSIAKDRNHIIGHGEKQNSAWVTWANADASLGSFDPTCNTHTDPGAFWNWDYFMNLILKTNVTTGRYWDLNGMVAGSGSAPTGTWDTTSTNWNTDPNGTGKTVVWGTTADAMFSAGTDATNAYTVTINGSMGVYSIWVKNADVTFTGGKLAIGGFGSYYTNYASAGHTTTFNTPFASGGGPDKWGPGTVVYNGSSSPSGYFSLNEGTTAVGHNRGVGTNKFVIGDSAGNNVVVFKAANATARLLTNDLVINSLNFTFGSGGDLTFSNNYINIGSTVKTITVSNNTTFNGYMYGSGGITKTGPGTLTYSGDTNNVYSGATTVNGGILKLQKDATFTAIAGALTVNTGGTLLLAASDQINNSSAMTLGGGVFSTAGFDEQLGTLKLTANSRIDLGSSGTVLKFAASSAVTWTAGTTLTVSNWNGSINGGGAEQLFIGTTSAGVSASQLNQLKFVNPPGFAAGTYSSKILATGEVVPVAVAPTITTQPQSQNILLNSNVTFFVVANGTANLGYQWRFGGTNLAGATTSQLLLTNVALDKTGFYSVVITNIAGSLTSSNALLSVYASAAANLGSVGADINGNLTLTIAGVPGYNYIIEASTNLTDWNPVKTNVSPFNFTDANTTNNPALFYRAVYVP